MVWYACVCVCVCWEPSGEISAALASGRFVTIRDALSTDLAESLHAELAAAQADPKLAFRRRTEDQQYKGQAAGSSPVAGKVKRKHFTQPQLQELYAAVQGNGKGEAEMTTSAVAPPPPSTTKEERLRCCDYDSGRALWLNTASSPLPAAARPVIYHPDLDDSSSSSSSSSSGGNLTGSRPSASSLGLGGAVRSRSSSSSGVMDVGMSMCQGALDAYDQKFQFEVHGTSYHPIAGTYATSTPS